MLIEYQCQSVAGMEPDITTVAMLIEHQCQAVAGMEPDITTVGNAD